MLPSSLYAESVIERLREELRFVNFIRFWLKCVALATLALVGIYITLVILEYQKLIAIDFAQITLRGVLFAWGECILFAFIIRLFTLAYRKICKWITSQSDRYVTRRLK